MDCFLAACRVYSSQKVCTGNSSDADAEDALSHSSSNSSMFCSEDGHGATSNLKRQRAVAFFMRFYVCGIRTSVRDEGTVDANADYLLEVGLQSGKDHRKKCCKEEKEVLQWWEEGANKRRKLGSDEWVAGESSGNLLRRAPERLKKLLRRVRAKVRKMGQVQKAASFHYDPVSYSMNFDEGCWQHCESHANVFYAASLPRLCSSQQGKCKVPSGG
ncbi:hypothetical protein GOP47_0029674 [Adiantum capillus-veneris]|nr:hypothetical protein GOP47_0029674 [Adiantum capillus-veneris]